MKCEMCNKEVEEFVELFGKQVCLQCIKDYEEGDDIFNLMCLENKRGREWILKHLTK